MPIHDQGYRRYGGTKLPQGRAWWVIARTQIFAALKYRPFIMLLLASWGQFVVRSVQIYIASSFPQAAVLAVTPQTFREFLGFQSLFVFLVTVGMAGSIADDRRANALQLYLSKPLTRVEYITGRLVPPLVFLLGVTLLPAMLLLVVQVVFAGSTSFLGQNLFLIPAITLFSLLVSLVSAFSILALSSLSRSRRFVSIMYAGIIFFTAAMYQALRAITGSRAWAVISPQNSLEVIGDTVFRVRGTPAVPPWVAVLVVAVIIGAAILILERRVRGIEVVT